MLILLLLTLTWDPMPPGSCDRLEATAWVLVPDWIACLDDAGQPDICLVGYTETFRQVQTVPPDATGVSWQADLPSQAVAYMTVRAGRASGDGVCWDSGWSP
jgi:hypothetical protein